MAKNKTSDQATEMAHSTVNVTVIRSSATDPVKDTRLVNIEVSYPKDYKGKKVLVSGKVYEVSPETAASLVSKGIAKKV